MRTVVVYHSQTGFTRRYAEWIADAAGGDCFTLQEARKRDLSGYDAIVYGGWACAGQISKIGWFEEQIPAWNGKRLAAFCVGASPADNPEGQVFLDKTVQDLAAATARPASITSKCTYSSTEPTVLHCCEAIAATYLCSFPSP